MNHTNMKRYLTHIITYVLLITSSINAYAIDANSALNNVAKKFSSSKSISATFSLIDNGHSEYGTIILSGNKFVIKTKEVSTWFDGKTQWSYSSSINEVNISEPTATELQQINPFAIINNFKTAFNAKLLNSPKGCYKILLTAKDGKQPTKSVELTINSATNFPSLIVITAKNNSKATIKIKTINAGNKLPESTFKFNPKNYPGVEIIDLR